jgi:hypothetical protein
MQAMMFAGQALQAVNTIVEGNTAARVGENNAKNLEATASANRRATVERENLTRQRSASDLSKQRTAMLQSGIDPTAGTALFGTRQSLVDTEMDALTVRYQGLMEAQKLDTQAQIVRAEGKQKRRAANLSATAQLLSSAGNYLTGGKQAPAPVETRTIG